MLACSGPTLRPSELKNAQNLFMLQDSESEQKIDLDSRPELSSDSKKIGWEVVEMREKKEKKKKGRKTFFGELDSVTHGRLFRDANTLTYSHSSCTHTRAQLSTCARV